jgi:uncharacterized protein YgbK (DUF1537 family)
MRVVLADDLSGAAEVAGIAWRCGLRSRVSISGRGDGECDVLVISTETRLAPAAKAAAVVRALGVAPAFKKIDSVLRGPVRAEVEAALALSGKTRALLVPANPSMGRTIHAGQYAIHGVALADTAFKDDPDYPAHTSSVVDLLARVEGHEPLYSAGGGPLPNRGIVVGDAETIEDVAAWSRLVDDRTLAAGGSDFFRALLGNPGLRSGVAMPAGRVLTVSGTLTLAEQHHSRVFPMRDGWIAETVEAMRRDGAATMALGRDLDASRSADFLEQLTAAAVAVIDAARPDVVCVEGGSTAASLARRLGWDGFAVEGEAATGVSILVPDAAPQMRFVVKPGSYLWPQQQTTFVVRYPRTVHPL